MRFLNKLELAKYFDGKSVAIVGSGPGVLQNEAGFIDSHDVVVRVNNYKLSEPTGYRTDVYYSYFGNAIKKTREELQRDGVYLCMCKCPNSQPIHSRWHVINGKLNGVDFRWIYQQRAEFWFCDTYIPTDAEFLAQFNLLGRHVPTTGFSAILDVLSLHPSSVYLTGFDFFQSRVHNVNEKWSRNNPRDPIKHMPEKERQWILNNLNEYPISCDAALRESLFPVSVLVRRHRRVIGGVVVNG